MGRASNRKEAQRQAGPSSRKGSQDSLVTPQMMHQLINGLQVMVQKAKDRDERDASARRAWCGGADPVPAEAPPWPEGSLGDRFFGGTHLEEASTAPCLLTAEIPVAAVITADPAHWNVAANALIRAIAFDGLALDHPAVTMLLEVLAPIAGAELAHAEAMEAWLQGPEPDWDDDGPQFPDEDGPVFLLGACALMDALWATVGEDPLTEVRRVLVRALAGAVPAVDSEVAADALLGAFATEYRCDQPGDAEVLRRIKTHRGDPLENLVAVGAVPPRDILPAGLAILGTLTTLCCSDAASVLQRAV